MPINLSLNRAGQRRPVNQDAARPAGARPPANAHGAHAPGELPGPPPRGFLRRGAMQAQLQAQMQAQQQTREGQQREGWNAWAQENVSHAQRAARQTAVHRMRSALPSTDMRPRLDLSDLGLTSLPPNLPAVRDLILNNNPLVTLPEDLPDTVEGLFANNTQLTRLPQHLPPRLHSLAVASNSLTELPDPMPSGLINLRAEDNRLTRLPEQWSRYVRELHVNGNQITQLPSQLPRDLRCLDATNNRLTSLPENLPSGMRYIRVSSNALTELPRRLPSDLWGIDLRHNQLTDVRRHIPRCVRHGDAIRLAGNPLSANEIQRLTRLSRNFSNIELTEPHEPVQPPQPVHQARPPQPVHQARPHQPVRQAQPPQAAPEVQANPAAGTSEPRSVLARAVGLWAPPPNTHIAATMRQWEPFAQEPGADAFAEFLNRLRGTVNFDVPQFQRSVIQWLSQLAVTPSLRRDTFAASVGATESCQDRISLTYNSLRKLGMASDVARGQYDHRLPDLISLARGVFRLDQLEIIASEHAARLERRHGQQNVDPIEVYLAYQIELREPLSLPVETTRMAYRSMARVTDGDIRSAQRQVLDAERRGFMDYLAAEFAPWQEVLRRLDPTGYENTQEALIEAMDDEFTRRLSQRMRDLRLEGDADAERTLGPQVQAEITREIKGRLTRDFLTRHGLIEQLSSSQQHSGDWSQWLRSAFG